MRELLLFVIAAAAGVISGMGMGGGTLLIPALTLLMGIPQRQAQGVNMLSFLPAAAAACQGVPAGLTEAVGDLAALTVAAYRLRLAAEKWEDAK